MPVSRSERAVSAGAFSIRTAAVRGGWEPDPSSGAIVTPIVQSTAFAQEEVGRTKGHAYSRVSNPTVDAFERALGAIEEAEPAVAFSSGLSATTTLLLSLVRSGDEVLISDVVYGGTTRLLQRILEPLGVAARTVDTSSAAAVGAAISPRTRVLFVESPGNPTLKLADIEGVSRVARAAGVRVVVDNTFLTAAIQRPLDLGADITLYSTTKYIEGHNSTVGGAVVSRDGEFLDRLRFHRKALGTIQSPFESWLTLRGLKTLPLRLREQSRAALVIARFLRGQRGVERVYYPGLADFPQAELAAKQLSASGGPLHGGIVSFELAGGGAAARLLLRSLRLCTLAENLGAVETLVTHPATMTHADVPPEQRRAAGISDGLVRLSVGLEDPVDIIADVEQALESVWSADAARGAVEEESGLNGVAGGERGAALLREVALG